MLAVPSYLNWLFILTTALTLFLVYRIVARSSNFSSLKIKITVALTAWLMLQFALSYSLYYAQGAAEFPLSFFPLLPPLILLALFLFFTKKGKAFIEDLPMESLVWLSIVRIPVEITLYYLFVEKAVPEIMTFAGRNFDILAGLTAPLIVYFALRKKYSKQLLLLWNVLGTILLLNIIVTAILSAPFPIQRFGFDQPNMAILHFPFSWLASFVAPMVLISHFIMIRQLLKK